MSEPAGGKGAAAEEAAPSQATAAAAAAAAAQLGAAWEATEDKPAVAAIAAAAALAAFIASGLMAAVDRVPLAGGALEVVGIAASLGFAYRRVSFAWPLGRPRARSLALAAPAPRANDAHPARLQPRSLLCAAT